MIVILSNEEYEEFDGKRDRLSCWLEIQKHDLILVQDNKQPSGYRVIKKVGEKGVQ